MTNKRYIVDCCEVMDTWKGEFGKPSEQEIRENDYFIVGIAHEQREAEDFCDLLNEQHETIHRLKENIDELLSVNFEEELLEENRQLKERNKKRLQRLKNQRKELEKQQEAIWGYKGDIKQLKQENEQLKAQLYCDDEEGVCNICKHHYLIKDDESELGYYNSRCKKGHYECASVSLKYCEDFEKKLKE